MDSSRHLNGSDFVEYENVTDDGELNNDTTAIPDKEDLYEFSYR